MTPNKSTNPTINKTTTNATLNLSNVAHDTYTLQITSDVYKPYTTTVVVNGETTVNIHLEALLELQAEWRPKSKVTTIPFTTEYIDDPALNIGVEIEESAGVLGKTTETWEAEYINGIASGRTRNHNTVTVDSVPKQIRRGTNDPNVVLENIITQENLLSTYATNIYKNNVRIPSDVVPIDGSLFEMRQWDNPTNAIEIGDGDLEPNSQYTIAFELEQVTGTVIEKAHFAIGMSFFGGAHYFNGTEVTIEPSAGEYVFTTHMPSSGKVTYLFQFTTEPDTPTGDTFRINFDNATNSTRVNVSSLGLYEGHVNPFN